MLSLFGPLDLSLSAPSACAEMSYCCNSALATSTYCYCSEPSISQRVFKYRSCLAMMSRQGSGSPTTWL
ncbi:uncharacterized protein BKA78DRAFT_301367 [Phyllosticta capitalensis]|uniref:uncharacterized protein n=1 Tax=Phyllosticta capitalensis TaxID=121624 RepID=UPI0031312019